MADRSQPDYQLDDELTLDAVQVRQVLEPTRSAIIDLLGQRAATVSQLAEALGKPKGTVGHHCKTLEEAGLIRVVRTRMVRAIQAKYYGRTARTFVFSDDAGLPAPDYLLNQASMEIHRVLDTGVGPGAAAMSTIRFARIPDDRAEEWAERLKALALEFADQPRAGERIYGMTVALFPTAKPILDDEESE